MKDIRSWATPFTIGAFFLSGLTGIMMFFGLAYGLIRPVHEWLSWLFVIGSVFHIQANWKVFISYFTKPLGRGIIASFVIIILIAFLPFGGGGRKSPNSALSRIVSSLPIETVATALNERPEELVKRMNARGINVSGRSDTISEIAAANGMESMRILRIVID